jgi:hypothetical protein
MSKFITFLKVLGLPLVLFTTSSLLLSSVFVVPNIGLNRFLVIIFQIVMTIIFLRKINVFFAFLDFPNYKAAITYFKEEKRVISAEKRHEIYLKNEAIKKEKKAKQDAIEAIYKEKLKELKARKDKIL